MKLQDLSPLLLSATYSSIFSTSRFISLENIRIFQLSGNQHEVNNAFIFLQQPGLDIALTWAQTSQQPDNLIPLPEIPESPSAGEENGLPPELGLDPSLEPEITIHEGKDKTMIEEYRVNGELYVIKITPGSANLIIC